ncbi:MAG: hypothetical protein ACOY5Y_15900 [Pseudomonadota bacterium]
MTQIAIVRFEDGWQIVAGDGHWGRFGYRVDAEEAALRIAERIRSEGGEVEILAQDVFGHIQPLTAA